MCGQGMQRREFADFSDALKLKFAGPFADSDGQVLPHEEQFEADGPNLLE